MNSAAGTGEENLRSALNKAELEALDTLKLQYFQNATRYLAKGDYDNALTEIKRVLLIDPDHRLAREYEIRVTELQAARALTQKAEPALPERESSRLKESSRSRESSRLKESSHSKESPRPAAPAFTAAEPVLSSRRASGKTWLYVALIVLLLIGTAGVLTLEKVNDEAEPAVATVAAVNQPVSAPVEQPVETPAVEEPTPSVQVPVSVEPKQTPAVEEKSVSRPEPVRKEPLRSSSERTSTPPSRPSNIESVQRSGAAGTGLLAAVTEKKVEPPPAPVKKEVPLPAPEVKVASTQAPPPEPAESSVPFVATEKEPKLVHLEKVRLPSLALRTNPSGEVKAKVLVDKEGKAQQVEIVSSTNSLLDQAVIDALQNSTYSPGMMGNDAVSAWLVIPFKFK